jgi:iron(III) transport system substrate-binding protein
MAAGLKVVLAVDDKKRGRKKMAGRCNRIVSLRLFVVALFGLIAASRGVCAEPKSVAEIAGYAAADRQAVLEAGAKSEGKLLVYSTGVQNSGMVAEFEKRYPFLTVTLNGGDSTELTRKAVEEFRAGRFDADVFELTAEGLLELSKLGVLQSFRSPETASFAPEAIGRDNQWVSLRQGLLGIGYNTAKISSAEAPKGNRDLLDPRWKGRMAITNSTTTTIKWVGSMVLTEGEGFVRQLGQQDIRVYSASARAVANFVISGEVELSPTIFLSHVETSSAQGAPIAWVPPALAPVDDTSIALAAHTQHPFASMLYIDFMLSKDAQLMSRTLGYLSARRDMPSDKYPSLKKLFMVNRPDYVEEYDAWSRLYRDVFLNGTAAKP